MNQTKNITTINCTHNTAGLLFIIIGTLFLFVGCGQIYKSLGLTEEQAAQQTAQDQNATAQILTQTRTTTTEIITTALAGLGAILSGILAKWLGTERKITTALITGIESATTQNVKKSVQDAATAAGIEPALHKRVVALT